MNRDITPEFITRKERAEILADKEIELLPYHIERSFKIATNRNNNIFKRVKAFWRGENDLGRGVGRVLDVVLLFLPRVQTGRQLAKSILINKHNAMPILKDKPWYESKTVWSAILVILLTLLNVMGVDAVNNPETMQTVYTVSYALAGALGLIGLRDAIGQRKDDANS